MSVLVIICKFIENLIKNKHIIAEIIRIFHWCEVQIENSCISGKEIRGFRLG